MKALQTLYFECKIVFCATDVEFMTVYQLLSSWMCLSVSDPHKAG